MNRCTFCGAPSEVDPSDQTSPPDYCHPEDHVTSDADGDMPVTTGDARVFQACDL